MKFRGLVFSFIAFLAFVGCQRSVDKDIPMDEMQIKLGANAEMSSTGSKDGQLDVFGTNDKIGTYSILTTNNDIFTDFLVKNAPYTYGTPYWQPTDGNARLLWPSSTSKLFLYAYYPLESAGSAVSVAGTTLTYTLPVDQSAQELHTCDFMYAVNKGTGEQGLSKVTQGETPVMLSFTHKLCKLRFNVSVTKDAELVVTNNKVTLKSITVSGPEITSGATMTMKNGTFTGGEGDKSVLWSGAQEITVGDGSGYVLVADMLVIPFVAQGVNSMRFYVEYQGANGPANTTLTYTIPTTGDVSYIANRFNSFKAMLNLSDRNVGITASIKDWDFVEHIISPN